MRRFVFVTLGCYIFLLAAGLGVGSFVQHKRSLVPFTVNIPQDSMVKVYADQGGDGPFQYNSSKPLFTLVSSQKIKTKVGVYDFVIEPGTDYKTNTVKTTINNFTSQVSVNPDFSSARLQTELAKNKDQILNSLYAKFSDVPKYYSVNKVELYKHGEWAGLTLGPISDKYDPVRFVLHKENGNWSVVNTPTIFVLGSLYTDVPGDVVSSVNAM